MFVDSPTLYASTARARVRHRRRRRERARVDRAPREFPRSAAKHASCVVRARACARARGSTAKPSREGRSTRDRSRVDRDRPSREFRSPKFEPRPRGSKKRGKGEPSLSQCLFTKLNAIARIATRDATHGDARARKRRAPTRNDVL
jgi:hypothetical protein